MNVLEVFRALCPGEPVEDADIDIERNAEDAEDAEDIDTEDAEDLAEVTL